jgi:hypothetical protein
MKGRLALPLFVLFISLVISCFPSAICLLVYAILLDEEAYNHLLYTACTNAGQAVWHTSSVPYPWAENLRNNWSVILSEFHAYEALVQSCPNSPAVPLISSTDPNQERLNLDSQWRALWLKVWGRETDASAFFPKTMDLLNDTPLSTAMISRIEARSSLDTHVGYFGGILRYHLGLVIPPQSTATLTVSNITGDYHLKWSNGGDLLFDDMHPHRVDNTDRFPRIVLFADLPRPDCEAEGIGFLVRLLTHDILHRVHPEVGNVIKMANLLHAEGMQESNS